MTDYYKILGVPRDATEEDIKQAYHKLAKKYHPDVNPAKSAVAKFQQINEANGVLTDPAKRARFDKSGSADPIVVASKKNSYTVEDLLAEGDVANIYKAGPYVLKVARESANNDLLQNEAKHLKTIFPVKEEEKGALRYLVKLLDSFRIAGGGRTAPKSANVLTYLEGFASLVQVRGAFPSGVGFQHSVWMFNRVLEALDVLHRKHGLYHGGVLPPHIMVYTRDSRTDPYTHGGKLIGFSATGEMKQPLRIVSPTYEAFYPPEVFSKGPTSPSTDIYMAVKSLIYVLGGNPLTNELPPNVPAYLTRFLHGCLFRNPNQRPQDAWALHEELAEIMLKNFGPKKYIKFELP